MAEGKRTKPALSEKQAALVQAMMGFARKTRQCWATRLGDVNGGERLTDRDWALLEWISEKGEVPFGEAVRYMRGKSGTSGASVPAVTQAIGRIVKGAGLLRAKRTLEDERKKTLTLTRKGARAMARRREIRDEMYLLIFKSWEPLDDDLCEQITAMFLRGIQRADEIFGNEG